MGSGFERRGRSRGGEQDIHLLEGRIEIAPNQGAHLLSFFVVGIHVTGGEGVGADQNPSLHLSSEPFRAA